ncbi:MAG TPA: sucrase ferredoxin [Actinomycetota bacterium]
MSSPERCSAVSLARGEPLRGTASTVVDWLLVEEPGPWGRRALRDSRLPPRVAAHLRRQARRARVRVVLIRRHGRHVPEGIQVFAAHAGAGSRWLERAHLPGPEALLEVDLSGMRGGGRLGLGSEEAEPIYLVCTNGRHDVCCSERGRPVANVLHRAFGDRVWEVSHIGGDRFAPNVVCLPAGVYLGRVEPGIAVDVVSRFDGGEIPLECYRGRCAYPFATQAAESFLRENVGASGLDDVVLMGRTRLGEEEDVARFRVGPAQYSVEVRVEHPGPERTITCSGPFDAVPPAYRLVRILRERP